VRRSRPFHALRRACAAICAIVTTTCALSAYADGKTGAETLGRAKEAWDGGEFDRSEPLYREALDRGGLTASETLDCYVHLGAARAVMGRKSSALGAFRQAALLDPRFVVPPEAGKKANTLANQARRAEAKVGPFQLRTDVPESAPANKPFKVAATVDATHAALISKVGISARDPTSDKGFEKSEPAATSVSWEVPATVAQPNATVSVRVDALDGHDNRLVSIEKRVRIEAATEPAPVAVVAAPVPNPNAWAKTPPPANDEKKEDEPKKGGGFWTSPWPYVIGGAVLAAGGAAVYLGTRPTDDVTVGAASVRVR
jgi:hypothetical protein